MKAKHIRHLTAIGIIVLSSSSLHAAAITQIGNDTSSPASSFVEAPRWSNNAVPSSDNTYSTNGFLFRTPATNPGSVAFAGASLSIDTKSSANGVGATVITKGTVNQTVTFPNLILNGGIFSQGNSGVTHTIAGAITANAVSGFSITDSSDRHFTITAPVSGSARLHVGSFNNYNAAGYTPSAFTNTFTVSGDNSSFSGGWALGGSYDATFFGGVSTYNVKFNASGTTFRIGHANALGTGTFTLHAGTLNLNGFSPTGLAGLRLADSASGTIRCAGNTLTATTLDLGTTTGATMNLDTAGVGNPVTAPIVSTNFNVNGPSTIGLRGTAIAPGNFPLIAYSGSIGGLSGLGGLSLVLPPGVSGSLTDNPGVSLNVTISNIEKIKWTNGAGTGAWNINTDINWKTTGSLADSTYQQNVTGGHSVLFDESETTPSPVAVSIPATVSPNAMTINNPTKNYTFSGQPITGTAAFVKDGAGTVNFGNTFRVTGGNALNLGKVIVTGSLFGTTTSFASGATLEYNATANFNQSAHAFTGAGNLQKTGSGTLTFNAGNSTIALGAGSLIDVQAGRIQFGNFDAQGCSAASNQGDMNIAAGAIFDGYAGTVAVDKLTGSGTYQAGYFGPRSLTVGVNHGSSTFSGTIKGNGVDGNSQTQLIKRGNGTLTLTGTINARGAYGGSSLEVRGGTTGSPSTLVLSPSDPLSVTGYTGGGIFLSPGPTDVTVTEQTAGTLTGSVLAVAEHGQGTFNMSGGTVNAGRMEFAWNGGGNNGPAIMNLSGTARINVNSNGQILMGQYWGRPVTINQSGGEVIQFSDTGVTRGGTGRMNFYGANQNLTWNLSGGMLSIAGIGWTAAASGLGGGNGILNLNGGILQITNSAFSTPTGTANGKPVFVAKILGDELTPDSGARIDNYGLAITFAAPIQHGPSGVYDGGLKLESSVPGGSLTLTGTNTYTGDTSIVAGNTLVLASSSATAFVLDGLSANRIKGAGSVTLDGTFTVDTTFADLTDDTTWSLVDVGTLTETFGSSFNLQGFVEAGTSGVHTKADGTNTWTFDESTGVLTLNITPAGGYASWISGFTVADATAGADPDNDGIENLLEYVFDGDPSVSDPENLPDLNATGPNLTFSFQRRDDSELDSTQVFQYGSNLAGWTDVAIGAADSGPDLNGVSVTIHEAGAAADEVTVTVPKALAADGKLFGRLKATQP
jgi:autotransporter-associated beta strand protein